MRLKLFITLSEIAFDFAWLALTAWLSPYWADGKAAEKIIVLGRKADLALARHPDTVLREYLIQDLNTHLDNVQRIKTAVEGDHCD